MSVYPGALDTANGLYQPINNFRTTLRAAITSTTSDIPIVNASGLQPNNGLVSIDNEVIHYDFIQDQNTASPILRNCLRGFDGTTSAAHGNGADVELRWVAGHHNILSQAIRQIEAELGIAPAGGFTDLAERLAKMLPAVLPVATPTADWSFTHDRNRIVGIQLWRKAVSGKYEQFTAQIEQELNLTATALVTINLDNAEEGFLVVW